MNTIQIKKIKDTAVVPQYQTEGAAGFDLHATDSDVIMPGETKLIGIGLAFAR